MFFMLFTSLIITGWVIIPSEIVPFSFPIRYIFLVHLPWCDLFGPMEGACNDFELSDLIDAVLLLVIFIHVVKLEIQIVVIWTT